MFLLNRNLCKFIQKTIDNIYVHIKKENNKKRKLTSFNVSRFLKTLNHCSSDETPESFNHDFDSLFTSSNRASPLWHFPLCPVFDADA